jgi:hypothetical protein
MATENFNGIPWFTSKPECAIFNELQYACVYAAGPETGRPLRLGASRNIKNRMTHLQNGCWLPLKIHEIWWVVGEPIANRLRDACAEVMDKAKRRLIGEWFDVDQKWMNNVITFAAGKQRIALTSHARMLADVRDIREKNVASRVREAGF